MKKTYSKEHPQEIAIYDKIKGSYIVAFDIKEVEDGYEYLTYIFNSIPSVEDIKDLFISYYNTQCDLEIVHGFYFEGNQVWLTTENTFNYKTAWDLAYQTNGANLPSTFKFGTNEKPVYRVFETVSDLQDFYVQSITYIENVLKKCWSIKDGIEWDKYKLPD